MSSGLKSSNSKVLDGIFKKIAGFLLGRVSLITKSGRFAIQRQGDVPARPWLTILGRDLFFETTREFPVRTMTELQKAIALQGPLAPRDFGQIYLAIPMKDGGFRVIFWVLQTALGDLNVTSRFWLPVTLLSALQTENGMFQAICADGKTLSWLNISGRFASTLSAVQPEQIAARVGVTAPAEVEAYTQEQFEQRLSQQLIKLPAHVLLQLAAQAKLPVNSLNWRFIGVALALSGVTYLAVTSAVITWRLDALSAELNEQGQAIEVALQDNKKLNTLKQQYNDLAEPLSDQNLSAIAFYAIAHAVSQGARLNSVEYNLGKVTLRGEADKALDILSELSKRPRVKNAVFSSPVNKGGTGERFVIEFELQEVVP